MKLSGVKNLPKKILFFSQYFWPEDFRVNDLAIEMSKAGYEVEVITAIPNYPKGKYFIDYGVFRPFTEIHESVKIYRLPVVARGTGKITLILNYLSFLFVSVLAVPFFWRKNYSAVFSFGISPGFSITGGVFLAKLKGIPAMTWTMDLWPETLQSVGLIKNSKVIEYLRPLFLWLYNLHTLVLTHSSSNLRHLEKYGIAKEKLVLFSNWAEDTYGVLPAKDTQSPLTILYAGNIGEAQDLPTLLNAVEILRGEKNIKWIILGDGRMKGWLESEVQRRGLSNSIQIVGRRPQDEMPLWFSKADLLYVSLKDDTLMSMTLPGRVQSYMASGKAILAVANGETADVVRASQGGFVVPAGDAKALAERVRTLTSPESREGLLQLGKNSRKYYEKNFARQPRIEQFKQLLDHLISTSH